MPVYIVPMCSLCVPLLVLFSMALQPSAVYGILLHEVP
jgi:hypothetical protein